MKILVAGATGAIGSALVRAVHGSGHELVGMVRSDDAGKQMVGAGMGAVMGDALNAGSVMDAVMKVRPDVIVNELTALPPHYTPEAMKEAGERDERVRLEGHANLLAAAEAAGVRRYVLQSSGFWYAPGVGKADESESFAFEASPGIAAGCRTYETLERELFARGRLQGVALRYGFFYGPGTWFSKDGDVGDQVRQKKLPVVGKGEGVWSWVHIDDAAAATLSAVECAPGVYNVVDDERSAQSVWLPAFARFVGAPEPGHVPELAAKMVAGADAVYYATRLRGAANEKAKRELGFQPRRLEWL